MRRDVSLSLNFCARGEISHQLAWLPPAMKIEVISPLDKAKSEYRRPPQLSSAFRMNCAWREVLPSPLTWGRPLVYLVCLENKHDRGSICGAIQKGLYNRLAIAPEAIILASCLFNKQHGSLSLLPLGSGLLSGRVCFCYFPNNSSLASQQEWRGTECQVHSNTGGKVGASFQIKSAPTAGVNADFPVCSPTSGIQSNLHIPCGIWYLIFYVSWLPRFNT